MLTKLKQLLNFVNKSKQLLILFGGTSAYVQARQKVMGTVTDNKGESIPGISVLAKGTTTGAITVIFAH